MTQLPLHRPTPGRARHRSPMALAAALAATLLASCGGADTSPDGGDQAAASAGSGQATASAPPEDSGFPVTVLSGPLEGGSELTLEERPEAIVSLSPTATETLWAIGAGDQVVAVDDQSDHPEGVPTTSLSGYQPNVEAILGYEPDLVVTTGDTGDLVSGLDKAGVPTLLMPSATDLEEAYSQMERLGAATGHVAEATALVGQLQEDIAAAVESAPHAEGTTYYHELDPTGYSVTGETFIGEVYALFGLTSIADQAANGDPYPQLSSEFVVEADPDLVFLADTECCDVSVEGVTERAGWAGMTAVQSGAVVALDEDIASRWGPRVVDFVELVGDQLAELEPANAG
ncbi:ABC transporter substrate-binding protein [Ornithinicoccus halotolerans]|uniref:ABC transporter substrate-binding protein n=1 Tax=Ornithinicoccus halotolerans TaxID=1748220 RepID=UPI001E3099E3|nr:ABC transporter substrate-binding protein [Ornithinicoccus halotolerans]